MLAGLVCVGFAQHKHLTGVVYHFEEHEDDEHGHEAHAHQEPLPGANVYWAGTTMGTTSDAEGRFHLEFHIKYLILILQNAV